ncbi:MAG TPA: RNA polymerase subunit sigma-70, partial [Streptosporangiaceae bacterium]
MKGSLASDAEIIRRSWDEPEQFAVLFRQRGPEIQRYVARRIGADAAEDVVAETFLVAFRQRSGYDLARTGRDPLTEPFTDRVDAEVSAGAAGRRLAAALAKLPPQHRDTLLLVAWGEVTYEQAA